MTQEFGVGKNVLKWQDWMKKFQSIVKGKKTIGWDQYPSEEDISTLRHPVQKRRCRQVVFASVSEMTVRPITHLPNERRPE